MKKNLLLKKRLCFRRACTFLLILMSVQVSVVAAETGSQTQTEVLQQKKMSGTVNDNSGRPIPGATVIVKGTTIGTSTDANGGYTLSNIPTDATIVFSFVGMKSVEVKITNQTSINVVLADISIGLDEVVAVGYGTQQKSDVTGATSTVKAEELVKRPIIRIEQALQGTTPGVSVVSNSGLPGRGLSVKIRGANSIMGSSEPLYVIDGNLGGNIEALNPNDVESMEVLKDASATAIYGSRGSNGVVLITTKSGKEGAMKVNLSAWFSQASIAKHLDLMNAYDFASTVNMTDVSLGRTTLTFSDAQLQAFKTKSTDWHKELEQDALIKNYQLDLSGGSSTIKYRISYNHLDQPGLILNQWYKKSTFRTNLDIKANDRLDLKFYLTALLPESRNNGYQGDLTDPFSEANIWDPTSPVRDPQTGAYIRNSTYGSAGFNPVAQASNQFDDNSSRSITGTGVLTYRILDNLTFTTNGTYNLGSGFSQSFRGLDTDSGNDGAKATINSDKSWSYQNSNFLTYRAKFGDHNFTVTALYEQQAGESTSVRAQSTKLSTPSLGYYNLGLGGTQQTTSGYGADALQSYMGRVNYSYKDKYLVTASYRIDGSSHLTEKYSQFPSVALGWNMMKENFMQNSQIINGLKLRVSYGETGNQAVGSYTTIPRVNTGGPYSYSDGGTIYVTTPLGAPVSPSLVWENTKQTDAGIDASFFKGRLTFSADVYNKDITNLLYNYQAPYYMGGGSYQRNMGSLNNKGIEIALGGMPVSNNAVTWNSYFTLSINRNKVVDLAGLDNVEVGNIGSAQGGASYLKVGRPLGEFYGYTFLGTWKTSEAAEAAKFGLLPGDAKYTDVNNDHAYNSSDLMPIGNGTPKFVFGFINDVKYSNFSLSFMFQGMYGNEIYSQTLAYIWGGQGQAKTPTTRDALNMWTPTNETDNPAFKKGKNFINSSRYVYDASFVKLKNLSFSYHVPETMLSKVKISSLEVYVSGQNILTITKYPGYDPEANNSQNAVTQGLEMGVIPNPRTYTLGFRLGF